MKNDNQKVAGCFLSMLALFVTVPISTALWFGVLTHIQAPTWMWVLFWIYVPTIVLFSTIRVLMDEVLKDE